MSEKLKQEIRDCIQARNDCMKYYDFLLENNIPRIKGSSQLPVDNYFSRDKLENVIKHSPRTIRHCKNQDSELCVIAISACSGKQQFKTVLNSINIPFTTEMTKAVNKKKLLGFTYE